MKIDLFNVKGEKTGDFDVPDHIFNIEVNTDVMHQAYRYQVLNRLHPVADTKDRGEVRGGGRKPWKQKGTGRSRHGSNRSPIWRKGGITFGPTSERNFAVKINKKMKRKALFMGLSSSLHEGRFILIDSMQIEAPKTKEAVQILQSLTKKESPKALVILPKKNSLVELSLRNIGNVKTILADSLNLEDILNYTYIVTEKNSIEVIDKTYKI